MPLEERSSQTGKDQPETFFLDPFKRAASKVSRALTRRPNFFAELKKMHAAVRRALIARLRNQGIDLDWDDEEFLPWYMRRKYILFQNNDASALTKKLEINVPKPGALPSNQTPLRRVLFNPDSGPAKTPGGGAKGGAKKNGPVKALMKGAQEIAALLLATKRRDLVERRYANGTLYYVPMPARKPKPWELDLA